MESLQIAAIVLGAFFVLTFAYRLVYIAVRLTGKKRPTCEGQRNRYAVLIAARNEEAVIGHLIDSLKKQDYPQELVDIYVVADNCSDRTAEMARDHGAAVFERLEPEKATKGYALSFLFDRIKET